ncbi:MAG: substrate-binding domain-containing protein [Anaerolineae bacterium]|nr:substrate-binding domain-containing protein [Anaerolineae bacterium]
MSTINDVAKRAGVSLVTVSRVINNAGNVSAATREKVERAIEELGYVPSVMARSLRSKRTRTLALIVSDVTNPFWTTVARGVEDTAQSRDYSVFLYNTDENPVKQQRYLDVVIAQRVDGVIIAPYDSDAQNLAQLRKRNIPTVIIDRRIEGWDVDSVRGDSLSGAKALVQHLISLGHERIAMISGPANTSTAEERVAGYCMALAEAGIPLDTRLIMRGEYRTLSGEKLTQRVLDEELNPTAIFAANNTIALGVINAVEKRGLRIPQDIALVCFDDLPNVSCLFPFLTVVAQPAYDMGVNAAQLLLSRLDSEVSLQPRHVVLPTRLIVRHSCGSRLQDSDHPTLSLPLPKDARAEESMIIKPLSPDERRDYSGHITGLTISAPKRKGNYSRPDVNRLLKVLQHQEADRVPHLEFWVTSKSVYEYVLERELKYDIVDARVGGQSIAPEDHVEFATRLGMDAVTCDFSWRPNSIFELASDGKEYYIGGSVKTWTDLDDLEPPPSLVDQLSYLERYLRAVQGTGVGVIASFTSFFDNAMLAVGVDDPPRMSYDNRPLFEKLMDILLDHQEKVMRVVCDRFADDLAFVMVSDDVAHSTGLMILPDMFMDIFPHRMKRLIAPAKEHGKLVAMHTAGKVDKVLPILHDVGFDAVHPIEPESNDIFEIRKEWTGKMALVGNIPTALLIHGNKAEVEEKVRGYCVHLASSGGYVLGSSNGIVEGIPPENFVAMTQAVHKYGRYGSLGKEA